VTRPRPSAVTGGSLAGSGVPVLSAARDYIKAGIAPGGTHANWKFLNDWVAYEEGLTKEDQLLLCDAQTSGGLLAAVPAERAEKLVQELAAGGLSRGGGGRADHGVGHGKDHRAACRLIPPRHWRERGWA